jgi:hypothetical protein
VSDIWILELMMKAVRSQAVSFSGSTGLRAVELRAKDEGDEGLQRCCKLQAAESCGQTATAEAQ